MHELKKVVVQAPMTRVTVLVPSNLLALHLKHQLSLDTGGHINIRFLTFIDLAKNLLQKKWVEEGRSFFPPFGEELLIEQLALNLKETSYFSIVAEQKGFLKALQNTFHDLLTGGVTEIPDSKDPKLKELRELFSKHRKKYLAHYA